MYSILSIGSDASFLFANLEGTHTILYSKRGQDIGLSSCPIPRASDLDDSEGTRKPRKTFLIKFAGLGIVK